MLLMQVDPESSRPGPWGFVAVAVVGIVLYLLARSLRKSVNTIDPNLPSKYDAPDSAADSDESSEESDSAGVSAAAIVDSDREHPPPGARTNA